jgi:putative ABC transport system permease protein
MTAPRLARLLLRLCVPVGRRDDVVGDLEEAHGRRRATGGAVRAWFSTSAEAVVIAAVLIGSRLRAAAYSRPWAILHPGDLRLGARLMLRQPILTLTAVISLAAGVGLATVGFAFMNTVLFSRLPFAGGDRFVLVQMLEEPQHTPAELTPASYQVLATGATTLAHIGGLTGGRENVTLPSGGVAVVTTAGITPTSLRYLPWTPLEGRLLVPADGAPGAPPVAMIRESFRRRALAGGAGAVGAVVTLAGIPRTIVGVVPDDFRFPNTPDIWLPIGEGFLAGRGEPDADVRLFGIVAPGRSRDDVEHQLAALAPSLTSARQPDAVVRPGVTTFTDLGPMGTLLATSVVGLVLTVLLVIAANVGNLILARSFARSREFAVRSALGAPRRRLVGQVFAEVLLLAGTAALAGAVAADFVLRRFNTIDELPFWVDFRPGPRTIALVVGATLAAAAVAGAWPALRATRRDLASHLQTGSNRASDVRFGRTAGVMVVVQIAVSVVMLHGAVIFARGLADYAHPSLSLPHDVLTTSLSVNATRRAPDGSGRTRVTAADVEETVSALPGVIAAGLSTALPRQSPAPRMVEVEPIPGAAAASPHLAPSAEVSAGFFDVLDARPVAGRLFTSADFVPGAPPVAVVNEPFVRTRLGGASPVGRRLRVQGPGGPGPWRRIVGVVPDLGLSVGDPSLAAGCYVPLDPGTSFVYLAMRTTDDPLTHAAALRRALLDRDPQLVLNRVERLDQVANDDLAFFRGFSAALAGIGVVTLVLALAGVYAMMALSVTRRTREIGIRVALGASPARLVRTIVGRAAWQVGAGGVLGAALAILSLQARAVLVSRLGNGGPWTLPLMVVLLVLAGLAATWWPLRRALSVRPTDALRAE